MGLFYHGIVYGKTPAAGKTQTLFCALVAVGSGFFFKPPAQRDQHLINNVLCQNAMNYQFGNRV